MKFTIRRITEGENEVILKYKEMTSDVERVFNFFNGEQKLRDINFFRCSKSTIINIDKVERLKSLPSNRIDATMCNGEHIMISRTYASEFRKRLRGGADDE